MNLSMRWLRDYVTLPEMTMRDYSEALTMSGSKVEGWETEGEEIEKVVAGKVLSIVPHENSDHMVITQIDVGSGSPLQIVTGAANVAVGDLVPVAVDGARLPGGHKIVTSALRGVRSEGMLCSFVELGLSANDFPYATDKGIFILQEECHVGQDIKEAIGYDDTTVEFEITSNRPDCLSVLGLARETAATFGQQFTPKTPVVAAGSGDIHEILAVEVQNPTLCPRYVARAVTNVKIGPSPRWMRERLRASGVRPINNIVDITNYVMLEYGQPMHAFDINCVKGGKIVVRNAVKGEALLTLDGIERPLLPEMLVIADAEKPSAVAGVMGGEDSGIHEDTVTVVFESANFLGSSVRITAKKLGMRTEASGRFEKGLDPAACRTCADRACELVTLLGIGEPVEGVIDIDHSDKTPVRLPLEHDWINHFIGFDLSRAEMVTILERIGFVFEGDEMIVPTFRADVRHKADVAEEIARFYGYDKIASTAIQGGVYGLVTKEQQMERRAMQALLSQGMYEVNTYTFFSPKAFDKIRLPAESALRKVVKILNPLGEDTSVMRTTIFPSMLEVLARNYNNRNASASFFEIAKEFVPHASIEELPDENKVIALGMYGEQYDYFSLKGILEELFSSFGIVDYDVTAVRDNPVFHPGRCAAVTVNGQHLAILGEVHPMVCKNFEMNTRAYLAKVSLPALFALSDLATRSYKPLPRFPASTRDIALLCDDTLPVLTIEKAIRKAVGDILESVVLFDHYKGAQIPEGKKSLAFALSMRAADRTLNDTEVGAAMEAALAAVVALGAELRG